MQATMNSRPSSVTPLDCFDEIIGKAVLQDITHRIDFDWELTNG